MSCEAALSLAIKKALREKEQYIEKLWNNCIIKFFDHPRDYPLEHNAKAKKDSRQFIEKELEKLEK